MWTHSAWSRAVALLVVASSATLAYSQSTGISSAIATDEGRIQAHLESGEFPNAIELIEQLPPDRADHFRGMLFDRQRQSGAWTGAIRTVSNIRNDRLRSEHLSAAMNQRLDGQNSTGSTTPLHPPSGFGPPARHGAGHVPFGGITENDYEPLINLITNTIASGKWQDEGGTFAAHPFPAGVFVDHEGTLRRISVDPAKTLSFKAPPQGSRPSLSGFHDGGNRDAHWPSTLRKVSLTRLQKAVQIRVAMGLPIHDTMANLAGLTSIEYVYADPDSGELVVAGPAGPWEPDSIGRSVGQESRQPVLQLDDLVVCLRNAWLANGKLGCTIDPRRENLARAAELIQNPLAKFHQREWQKKLREALGQQDIRVFGIDERTHAASVLVEADHHMKLIGMGLAPSIPQVASYFDRIKIGADSDGATDVIRWWFTAKGADIACDESRQRFELGTVGVRVQSESEFLNERGERIHTGRSTVPTEGFARDFTQHFDAMAARYPIYRELQNLFKLALVANLIKHEKLDQRTGLDLAFFTGTGETHGLVYPLRFGQIPKQVDSVVNETVIERRIQGSLKRTTLVGVSGGVEVDAAAMVRERAAAPLQASERTDSIEVNAESDHIIWWWD